MAENRMFNLTVNKPDSAEISRCSPPVRENGAQNRLGSAVDWKTAIVPAYPQGRAA